MTKKKETFDQRAEHLKSHLGGDSRYNGFFPRPFFVEFGGSPSSGKTTTIHEVDRLLRRNGFRVWTPQEGAEAIRHIPRSTPLYNMRTGLHALNILIDESAGNRYDIVLFDRGVFDACCWMRYWEARGALQKERADGLREFFLSPFWVINIDIAFYFVCAPRVALKREMEAAVTERIGDTGSPERIAELVAHYRAIYAELKPKFPQLCVVDTTRLSRQEVARRVSENILRTLARKVQS